MCCWKIYSPPTHWEPIQHSQQWREQQDKYEVELTDKCYVLGAINTDSVIVKVVVVDAQLNREMLYYMFTVADSVYVDILQPKLNPVHLL